MPRQKTTLRRQFLRGSAGFALALPFLPSLLPRGAKAKNFTIPPRFVSIGTGHGGVWSQTMHPADSAPDETMNYGGHTIRRRDVGLESFGDRAGISPVISGDSSVFTAALASKMNVIRGLDVPFYIGHHGGGHLGNWAGLIVDSEDATAAQAFATPTIDQVMAWSPSFYSNLDSTLERTMVIGHSYAYGWSSQETQADVVRLAAETSSIALFNRIFVSDDEEQESPRPPVVDRVLESYNRLRQSNRRLSARDRQRLDEHIERVDELQRRLDVTISCEDVPTPTQDAQQIAEQSAYWTDPGLNAEHWSLFNDVVTTAFACGTSRIAVMGVLAPFSSFPGDWHQDVAHQSYFPDGERQAVLSDAHQSTFEGVMLDLISKLDAVEDADGSTLLDNSLVQWTQESGQLTHESIDSCIVTAGSASGCLRTGQYLDYRNTNRWVEEDILPMNTGLLLQQYYASVLQLLGVSPEEYEMTSGGGYPELFVTRDELYPQALRTVRGDVLPWLQA